MTKQELIEMVGSEEQAEYAMNILLKSVNKEFIRLIVNSEIKEIDAQIQDLASEGVMHRANSSWHVSWGSGSDKCYRADGLLYKRNRTLSLIAAR